MTAHRRQPHLTVWVPAALHPGEASLRQVAHRLTVYLAPPGYGEMFRDLGFSDLVERARAGVRRSELAAAIPVELAQRLGAIGGPEQIGARLQAYLAAGADTVAVVPVTADDPAGSAVLECAADTLRLVSPTRETASRL